MRSRPRFLLLLVAVLLHDQQVLVHAAGIRPAGPRRVTGTVKDAGEHPVAGVHLRLENPGGEVVGRAQSDGAGHFEFRGVGPGTYTVVASKPELAVTTTDAVVTEASDAAVALTMESAAPEDIVVVAKRLDRARNDVYTTTGASVYGVSEKNVQE